MSDIFVVSDNIVSPLGSTTAENFDQLRKNISGIRLHEEPAIAEQPFYASLLNRPPDALSGEKNNSFSAFEELLISSIGNGLKDTGIDPADKQTIMIISSTKGNISLLENNVFDEALRKRISLPASAALIAKKFGAVNRPVIVSHACISGVLAIITAMRLLRAGVYQHAIVAGADLISKFVLSGFQSFQAISDHPCKPFDAERNGISLGEGAATIILSRNKINDRGILINGGSVSNDANHISGPSRTGEELAMAIGQALSSSNMPASEIDFISAHGTATLYNDEMEARAINLAGMQDIPVNSLKGYYGHTLGASGLIESVVSIQSLIKNHFLGTAGYAKPGTSDSIRISNLPQSGNFTRCLKTASGFGGCNAALVISKNE